MSVKMWKTAGSRETVLFGNAGPAELTYRYDTKAPSLYERDRQMTVTLRFLDGADTGCAVHDMITVTDREATCGMPGIQYRECRNCDYREEPTEIPATGAQLRFLCGCERGDSGGRRDSDAHVRCLRENGKHIDSETYTQAGDHAV